MFGFKAIMSPSSVKRAPDQQIVPHSNLAGAQVQVFRTRVLKLPFSILIRSRVFVCELRRIHFDAHAFLLVGNLFEGSSVVSGTFLQRSAWSPLAWRQSV
jgi:hypothetical protein